MNLLEDQKSNALSTAKHFGVPIAVRAYKAPTVRWLNCRWLLQNGYLDEVSGSAIRACERWAVETFAFGVPLSDKDSANFGERTSTFVADRYGNSNGFAPTGGSGRAAVVDRFQVKGVGPTPLISTRGDWLHSHGCLWLEEAFREVVYSELALAEFPHSAVPVIAVIDTGVSTIGDGSKYERRAILVRPFCFRLAHLDRAALYLPPKYERDAQILDFRRVKEAWSIFQSGRADDECIELLENTLRKIAEQLAFAAVHRLYPGGYFSSSFTVDGALIDFGGFRALPDWSRTFAATHILPFGTELHSLQIIATSLLHEAKKHLDISCDDLKVIEGLTERYHNSFGRYLSQTVGGPADLCASTTQRLQQIYADHQRCMRDYSSGIEPHLERLAACLDELCNARSPDPEPVASSPSADVEDSSQRPLPDFSADRTALRMRLVRFLDPRESLNRERLQSVLFPYVFALERDTVPAPFDSILASELTKGRRVFMNLHDGVIVMAQACSPLTECLVCSASCISDYFLLVRAARCGAHFYIFNQEIGTGFLPKDARLTLLYADFTLAVADVSTHSVAHAFELAFGLHVSIPELHSYVC